MDRFRPQSGRPAFAAGSALHAPEPTYARRLRRAEGEDERGGELDNWDVGGYGLGSDGPVAERVNWPRSCHACWRICDQLSLYIDDRYRIVITRRRTVGLGGSREKSGRRSYRFAGFASLPAKFEGEYIARVGAGTVFDGEINYDRRARAR